MKNKSKKIAMVLSALLITGSSVAMTTSSADAWSWKKSSTNKYQYKSYSKKYYSETDLEKIAKTIDKETSKAKKGFKKIGKSTTKAILGKKNPLSALKDYLKNMLGIGGNINNSVKAINKELNKLNFDTFK